MTLSQIRTQIQALQRKYAKELLIYRLRRQADQVYNQWARAVGDRQDPPQPHSIIRKFAAAGFFLPTYNSLHRYLEDLRQEGSIPNPVKSSWPCSPGPGPKNTRNCSAQTSPPKHDLGNI